MGFTNIEIKARTSRSDAIRSYLLANGAEFKGVDHQKDTYFVVSRGRLKLREGNIENSLIYYQRSNQSGPKPSEFDMLQVTEGNILKELLSNALGIKVVVEKRREIYFIENVKFHLDTLASLGEFLEIEASNKYAEVPIGKLQQQCEFYMKEFEVSKDDLINLSYSDMLLKDSAGEPSGTLVT